MFSGIDNQDLAKMVTCKETLSWNEKEINIYNDRIERKRINAHVVVIDFGVKKNILRCLSSRFEKISIVPCILKLHVCQN